MKKGNTTPSSAPRGYPDMGRFNPGAQKMVGNKPKLENDSRAMPAQGDKK